MFSITALSFEEADLLHALAKRERPSCKGWITNCVGYEERFVICNVCGDRISTANVYYGPDHPLGIKVDVVKHGRQHLKNSNLLAFL